MAKKLINKLKRLFHFKQGAIFIADAAYDIRDLYNFIVNSLKSQAFIPINPRNQQEEKIFGSHGCPLCDAKLEMKSWGSWIEGLRERLKFRCPIKAALNSPRNFPADAPSIIQDSWQAMDVRNTWTSLTMPAPKFQEIHHFLKKRIIFGKEWNNILHA